MYIKSFFKDRKVGALTPTSDSCIKKVIDKMQFEGARTIIEFGSGTGEFTRQFLEQGNAQTKIIAFETYAPFAAMLRAIDDPRLKVYENSAEDVDEVLLAEGIDQVDYIVSGIPFTLLTEKTRMNIIKKSANLLSTNGSFIAYQYSPFVIRKYLKANFEDISIDFTWRNLPPMFVMEARHHL
jgi:phospholipid N-methyltransferase